MVLPQKFSMFKLSNIPNKKYNQVLMPPHSLLITRKKRERIQGVFGVPKKTRGETPTPFTKRFPIAAGLRGRYYANPII